MARRARAAIDAQRTSEKIKSRLKNQTRHRSLEIWWLATNLDESVEQIVGWYARRMVIEEQFRDTKGVRFRMKLKWAQFTKAELVERMFL